MVQGAIKATILALLHQHMRPEDVPIIYGSTSESVSDAKRANELAHGIHQCFPLLYYLSSTICVDAESIEGRAAIERYWLPELSHDTSRAMEVEFTQE